MLSTLNISKIAQLLYISGILLLLISFLFVFLDHSGLASNIIVLAFVCFIIGFLFYFFDLRKNKSNS